MSSTVVVRGSGGFIFEMDAPAAGHALELFDERVAKGELTIITDPVEWVDGPDGSRHLVLAAQSEPAEDAPTGRRGRKAQAAEPTEDSAPTEE